MATGIIPLIIVIFAIAYGNGKKIFFMKRKIPAQYIPLPYGGLNIGKTADGSTAVDLGSSINVLGYGPQGSTRWVSGPNGFHTYGK